MPQGKPRNQPDERRGTCKFCDKETTAGILYFGQTKECVCRACKDRVEDGD